MYINIYIYIYIYYDILCGFFYGKLEIEWD